jgi:hypothetical protein
MRAYLLAASAASLVLVAAACGSDSSAPKVGPPARVEVITSPTASGAVKGSVGTLAVKVSDAGGQGVTGAVVTFSAAGGGGIVFTPTSATTDATGTARTTVVLGTLAGTATLSASVSGVTTSASFAVTTVPGALFKLVASPADIRLTTVGETAQITALLQDEFANTIDGTAPSYVSLDPTLVTVDANGLVKAVRVGGTTSVIATHSSRADTVVVAVLAAGASPCTGVAAPTAIAAGGMSAVTGATICLSGGAATAEYTVVAYNTSTDGSTVLNATIQGNGVGSPVSGFSAPSNLGPLAVRLPSGGAAAAAPVQDDAFHARMLSMSRGLRGMFSATRAARNARLSASTPTSGGRFTPSASRASIPATAAIGDLVALNTNGLASCSPLEVRTFRVAAVGTKSIVLADTTNPKNGFTDADYARFATRFDTLVYPVDVGAFGTPSDVDENGKVAILFTRAVNELTPANSNSFVGGFFFARDLFLKLNDPNLVSPCPGSNEGEMFYMLVPDPSGVVNGNVRRLGFVDTLTTGVIAHEFQHLINAGRRLYVNTNAQDFEVSWLNEGLSHIAEELLYYRESGMQARQNLDDAAIRVNSRATYPFWRADASSNFGRLIEYLENPGSASPLDSDDNLATRGSAWSFLRYAVDRSYASDASVWARFTNSTATGLTTVRTGLQTDPVPLLADWALANYIDDLGISTDPRYLHKSWNYRDIFKNTYVSLGGLPLRITTLPDNLALNVQVKGSSASYYQFAVAPGKDALITFASGGGAPNGAFKFTVVRTK